MPKLPVFPGILKPSIDMQAVRDFRRALPLVYLVDLSTARTIAANTALALPIAGTTFYADPIVDASGLPIGGVATVHFQDQNLGAQGTPFTVAPQFIARIPFTQILIENPAQAGKFLRIIYGIDLDFSPGINAQVSISGNVNVVEQGFTYATAFASNALQTAGTAQNILAAAGNLNGYVLHDAELISGNAGASFATASLLAKATAPATTADGEVLVQGVCSGYVVGAFYSVGGRSVRAVNVVSGKRLDYITSVTEAIASMRKALYTVK